MPADRIVNRKPRGKWPTRKEVGVISTDYFGDLAKVSWEKDRYFCKVVGTISHPLNRIKGAYKSPLDLKFQERWIEVWFDRSSLYVMTRMQDEVTGALAEGLASLFCRFYQGTRAD